MPQSKTRVPLEPSGMLEKFFSHDPLHSNRELDFLTVIAVGYIALPNLIFLFGWLKLPIATILGIGTLVSAQQLFQKSKISWRPSSKVILIFAIATTWCFFGGAGHFGYANVDWQIRDAVYGDLIHSNWPPAYTLENSASLVLRSAFGYFLLPSLVSSYLGIATADICLFAWTVIGTAIFLSLLPIDFSRTGRALLLSAIVIMFSGMDVLGILLTTGEWPLFPLRLEWWTAFSYSSLSGQLFWAPNHCLPIWIGTAIFYRHWASPSFLRLAIVFGPLTLIWTPFAIIALMPFLLLYLASRVTHGKPELPSLIQFFWALILGVIVTAFLTFDIAGIPSKTGAAHASTSIGGGFWEAYLPFVLMEFGVLAMFLSTKIKNSQGLFITAVFVLLALPFIFFGPSNDLLLRGSTPALVLLAIFTLITINDAINKQITTAFPWLIITVLAIGACTPFNEIWRAVTWKRWAPDYQSPLIERDKAHTPAHYMGNPQLMAFQWVLKPPHPVPTRNQRQ
jgi:hypothetical protein